ncbi:hypothetical protein L7F22_026202 [Adiantum nelumboides]|nr:hypothetical protein [Adiantum nelumboides]
MQREMSPPPRCALHLRHGGLLPSRRGSGHVPQGKSAARYRHLHRDPPACLFYAALLRPRRIRARHRIGRCYLLQRKHSRIQNRRSGLHMSVQRPHLLQNGDRRGRLPQHALHSLRKQRHSASACSVGSAERRRVDRPASGHGLCRGHGAWSGCLLCLHAPLRAAKTRSSCLCKAQCRRSGRHDKIHPWPLLLHVWLPGLVPGESALCRLPMNPRPSPAAVSFALCAAGSSNA